MTESIKWFSPSDVAEITGISPELQRDWRRRGFGYFGKDNGNGRWHYSRHDVLGIAIANVMRMKHIDAFDAARIGKHCATSVALHLGLQKVVDDKMRLIYADDRGFKLPKGEGSRFAVFMPGGEDAFIDERNYSSLPGLITDSVARVVDLKRLASEIPEKVVNHLRDF